MDDFSVFFLAQGEQSADAVMARLTTFIRAAQQSLDLAVYDMRFSAPLRTALMSALRERAEAGVRIRFCYDGDKPLGLMWPRGKTLLRRHRVLCSIVRLSLASHRRNETDAQQIHRARSAVSLDWLD